MSTGREYATTGSSPLARGLRIMPVNADNVLGDHPRSRGVYRFGLGFGVEAEGSSPLARGLLAGRIGSVS